MTAVDGHVYRGVTENKVLFQRATFRSNEVKLKIKTKFEDLYMRNILESTIYPKGFKP